MAIQQNNEEYDIVIAGGGTAACILAGRLSDADPSLSILIIEGGKNNLNDPTVVNPAIYLSHLAPDSQTACFYKAKSSEHLAGREAIVPTGGILGGGSSINFMMYTRAQGIDYDSWKTEGWDYKSVLPYLKKFETYHPSDIAYDKKLHGFDGPVNISDVYTQKVPRDDVIAASEALHGIAQPDLADFTSTGGFSTWARYVSPDGKRQDAAHRYIHGPMASGKYPNLHLLLETKVIRVVFDSNKRAIGFDYQPTGSFQPTISLSKPRHSTVRARKLCIVSAGALGTPSILERSGVGDKDLLKRLEIPVVSDLPGVGEQYQDHHLMMYPYKTNLEPHQTLDCIFSGRTDFVQALEEKNPILGWNSIDAACKLRISEEDAGNFGSEFKEIWARDFKDQTEKPFMLMAVVSSFLGDQKILPQTSPPTQYITMCTATLYPYSRGSIHITSPSVLDPASFDTGFLSDPHDMDLKASVWAYKKQREIYRRTNAFQGELEFAHPQFAEGSKARLVGTGKEGRFASVEERKSIQDIEYSAEDDKVIEDFIRNNLQTTWHSLGTCKMAPRHQGGVLDQDLNVYGTTALKVVDLSMVPENVGANTNNTALMAGEKAADMIMAELGVGHGGQKSNGWPSLHDGGPIPTNL